jgi:predicted phosphodiesterase
VACQALKIQMKERLVILLILKYYYCYAIREGMVTPENSPIGLISDSHGNNMLLLKAILMLKQMDVQTIIHLGDICDSLSPHALEDAVKILKDHGVLSIRGNNEYAILSNHQGDHASSLSPDVVNFLSGLPYTITLGDFCFAHSAPFDWPAATRRPITDYLPHLTQNESLPFKILFSGHSHTPSILEIDGVRVKKIPAKSGIEKKLSRNRHYVITVGAVEEASSALFLPQEYAIWFLRISRV